MNTRNRWTNRAFAAWMTLAGVTMGDPVLGSEPLPVLVDPRASEVAAMERTFCNSVFELGIRDGFLRHFSPDGILFRPGPVVCVEVYPTRPKSPASLLWTPEFADISSAGDLGYTFGPWELRPAGLQDTTFANGTYVTLWRREPDGTWKITLDWGIGHELEPAKAALLAKVIADVQRDFADRGGRTDATSEGVVAESGSPAITDLTVGSAELLEADRAIGTASVASGAKADGSPASGRIAKHCRFLRPDHPPLVGVDALQAALGDESAPSSSTPAHAFVSRSGDLGYVYGSYAAPPSISGTSAADQSPGEPVAESGYFLRIWKKQDGRWQVVLEMAAAG